MALDGQFLSVNRALCEIVGYEADVLQSKRFQDITQAEDLQEDLANVEQLLRGEINEYQMDKRYQRKNGDVVWVQLNVSLVRDRSGTPLHFLAQVQDITERRQRSLAIQAANEHLMVADELRARFVANVSHELQSPLTVIMGFADMLAESDPNKTEPETFHTAVDAISRQSRRLKRIVTDLLALSRLDEGVPIETEAVALRGFLETVLLDCAEQPSEWSWTAPPDAAVSTDPDRLAQILANIVANAERHGAPPFDVLVVPSGDDHLQIRISDHGPGIRPEFVPDLFERFSRGDRAHHEGSGLGLAISRGLARAQGGDVWYETHQPRGATFVVSLPSVDLASDASGTEPELVSLPLASDPARPN